MRLFWIDGLRTGRLAIASRPIGGDRLTEEIQSLKGDGVDKLVSLLEADEEAELGLREESRSCSAAGIAFKSFSIGDRGVPKSEDGLLSLGRELLADLNAGKSVAVHCRAGIGRSALVCAAVLRLSGETGEHAFEMIAKARGVTVPDTEDQRRWVLSLDA